MSAMVCGIQQQQCRRQDVAVRIPVSAHGDHGTINLDHRVLRPVLQSMGREEILGQHNVELLSAAHRAPSPGQVPRERVQPRQHLESTRLICPHWYAYAIHAFGSSSWYIRHVTHHVCSYAFVYIHARTSHHITSQSSHSICHIHTFHFDINSLVLCVIVVASIYAIFSDETLLQLLFCFALRGFISIT